MKILYVSVLLLAVFISACTDPAGNKPRIETTDSAAAPAGSVEPRTDVFAGYKAAGKELYLTPVNSKVEFTGSKVTGKHDGGFRSFQGVIDLVDDKPELSRVIINIDMTSIYADDDKLTQHLKTADFFEVEKFPKAAFVSTKIEPDGAADKFKVTGELDMHGVKKAVTFPATITITPTDAAVKADFSINRKDFGIAYAGVADDLIRDDVVIKLDLKTPKKK